VAYVEFLSAYSALLDKALLMYGINKATLEIARSAYASAKEAGNDEEEAVAAANLAVSSQLHERGRLSVDDFAAASTTANSSAYGLLLIEDDPVRQDAVRRFANAALRSPQSDDDYERFFSDTMALRVDLDRFTDSVVGAFASTTWHARIDAQIRDRRLDVSSQKVLDSKSSR
jgi:hypothetical protein